MERKKLLNRQGEWAYLYAVVLLAVGTVLCVKADLGMSMIAAPAYCLSSLFGGLMGFAEYILQGALLLLLCMSVRMFKWQYLMAFVTALLYGGIVNLLQILTESFVPEHLALRICLFAGGTLLVALSVALFFNTYFAPTVYDLFVKAICARYGFSVRITKTVFDCGMLLLSIILAIFVYGVFGDGDLKSFGGIIDVIRRGGVYIGTLITVCVNGALISFFDRLLRKYVSFEPRFTRMYELFDFTKVQ